MSFDDMNSELARRAAVAGDAVPASEVKTYADGSQRHGVPPFPELSPIEEQAKTMREANFVPGQDAFARAEAAKEAAAALAPAPAPAPAPSAPAGMVTADAVEATKLDAPPPDADTPPAV